VSSDASDAVCCGAGFSASSGYDPVTGLGSVSFDNLEAMLNGDAVVSSSSSSKDSNTMLIVEIVVPIGGFLLLCCIGVAVWYSLRKGSSETVVSFSLAFV
jgi:hypothetical protein